MPDERAGPYVVRPVGNGWRYCCWCDEMVTRKNAIEWRFNWLRCWWRNRGR